MPFEHLHQDIEWFETLGFGFVEEPIAPDYPGRVHYAGTSWPAQFACSVGEGKITPKKRVVVIGRLGTTLLIALPSDYKKCPKKNNEECLRTCLLRFNYLLEPGNASQRYQDFI